MEHMWTSEEDMDRPGCAQLMVGCVGTGKKEVGWHLANLEILRV